MHSIMMHETLLEGHCFEGGTLRTEKNALLEEMCHGKGRYVTVQNVPRVGFFCPRRTTTSTSCIIIMFGTSPSVPFGTKRTSCSKDVL